MSLGKLEQTLAGEPNKGWNEQIGSLQRQSLQARFADINHIDPIVGQGGKQGLQLRIRCW